MATTTEQKRPIDRLTNEHMDLLERMANLDAAARHVERVRDLTEERAASPLQGMGSGAAMSPGMEKRRMERPPLGAVVTYRARTREYVLPAIVTATVDSLDRRGVVRGDVPDITGEEHVHLSVMSCGPAVCYQEFDVPFSRTLEPGTWGWA